MTLSLWFSFLSFTIITALSPGPNNFLALTLTANYGIKQSRKTLLGIYTGFLTIMLLTGFFGTVLFNIMPKLVYVLKVIGFSYIIYLAFSVLKSSDSQEKSTSLKQSFFRGFALQFVNFKIIIWGLTAFGSFILPHYQSPMEIVMFALLLSLIGNSATHIWAIAGNLLSQWMQQYKKHINIIMALVLIVTAIQILIE